MQTTNTSKVLLSKALLNCGASNLFVNSNFVKQNNLSTRKLSCPILVYNVDGTPNKAGGISEVWDAVLWYHDHSKCVIFAVTGLGQQDIILRLTWLYEHNPEVDWQLNEVKMSRCLNHCWTCLNEMNNECKAAFREAECVCTCRVGPMLMIEANMEDVPDLAPDSDDEDDEDDELYVGEDALEDEDPVFIAMILCEAKFIHATLSPLHSPTYSGRNIRVRGDSLESGELFIYGIFTIEVNSG
jgi:hypothetical protein